MKEIAVISGKGGTGKSSITAALAFLDNTQILLADCDVDASNMHLLFKPDFATTEDFYSGKEYTIDKDKCIQCGDCYLGCRFDAISYQNKEYSINPFDCEGCGLCFRVCPENAIIETNNKSGKFHVSNTRLGNYLVHAKLDIAAENSGKLVSHIRKQAKLITEEKSIPYVLIDGSPGIGCPVIASITGTDFIILVTEPTLSGFHDVKRAYELVIRFNIRSGCIINKADINKDIANEIKSFLKDNAIELLAEIPYDEIFSQAITNGKTVVEIKGNTLIKKYLKQCLNRIKEIA